MKNMNNEKKLQAQLEICIGGYSDAGRRETNQDAFAVKVPTSYSERKYKGIVASLADGVSCSNKGQQASQTSVTQFINDYYCTAESWSVKLSASKVLNSLNAWLFQHSGKDELRHNGLITTFSTIIFKSTSAYIFHVGDSRIYRYRDGILNQLTKDHARTLYGKSTVLTRALGMDCNLEIDFQVMPLQRGDTFLLSSDGIHDCLSSKILSAHLATLGEQVKSSRFEELAKNICEDSLQKGSNDNLSCLILKVNNLPNSDIGELFNALNRLTIPPALSVGNVIDNFKIEKVVHQGVRSHVYLATEISSKKLLILKMPSLNFADDPIYLDGFCKEQWVGRKLKHPNIMAILPRLENSPFLYHICEYVEGITLRQWIQENPNPTLDEVRNIIKKVVSAVRIFQRSAIVHRDLKPDNIIISKNGGITLIDFGTVKIDGLDEISPPIGEYPVGAVDYIAPEYLNGGQATYLSDLFSIAVIAYELFCGELPYDPMNSQSLVRARRSQWKYRPIKQFRGDIPDFLDAVLKKATDPLIDKRYSSMSEFITDLFTPSKYLTNEMHKFSLIERSPIKFWQSLAFLFFAIVIIELLVILR